MNKTDIKDTWDLSCLGSGIHDPQFTKERAQVKRAIHTFVRTWSDDNSYMTNPRKLEQALDQFSQLQTMGGKEGYYLFLASSLDTVNTDIKAALKKYEEFYTPLGNTMTFFQLNLGKISADKQKQFLKDKRLSSYHFYLHGIFQTAQYTLSKQEENLFALLSGVAGGNWTDMQEEFLVNDTEMAWNEEIKKGKKVLVKKSLTFPSLLNNLSHHTKQVRDSAAQGVNTILKRQGLVTEKEINSVLERKKIMDNLRGYTRPDQSRHIADDIDSKTVDHMVKTVSDNFAIARDFYKFKANLLGKKKLAYHERLLEYGSLASRSFDYPDAVQLVHDAYTKLDSEFADIFAMFVRDNRIDAYPRKGKTDGAFCAGASKTTPTYILLNHGEKMRCVMTIAHEAGHGIHNEMMRPVQPPLYCGTTLATAEVSSTFCEDFALQELLHNADDAEKLTVLVQRLDDIISTIFRQVAFYNFETQLHTEFRAQGYLTNQAIGDIFATHMKSYMGPAISLDTGSENWWMYVGHFRRPFYVYTYASGLMISMALRSLVKQDPSNIEKVKTFMRAGSSKKTEDIFKDAGIDISKTAFWEHSITEIKLIMKEAKQLAKKLGKI